MEDHLRGRVLIGQSTRTPPGLFANRSIDRSNSGFTGQDRSSRNEQSLLLPRDHSRSRSPLDGGVRDTRSASPINNSSVLGPPIPRSTSPIGGTDMNASRSSAIRQPTILLPAPTQTSPRFPGMQPTFGAPQDRSSRSTSPAPPNQFTFGKLGDQSSLYGTGVNRSGLGVGGTPSKSQYVSRVPDLSQLNSQVRGNEYREPVNRGSGSVQPSFIPRKIYQQVWTLQEEVESRLFNLTSAVLLFALVISLAIWALTGASFWAALIRIALVALVHYKIVLKVHELPFDFLSFVIYLSDWKKAINFVAAVGFCWFLVISHSVSYTSLHEHLQETTFSGVKALLWFFKENSLSQELATVTLFNRLFAGSLVIFTAYKIFNSPDVNCFKFGTDWFKCLGSPSKYISTKFTRDLVYFIWLLVTSGILTLISIFISQSMNDPSTQAKIADDLDEFSLLTEYEIEQNRAKTEYHVQHMFSFKLVLLPCLLNFLFTFCGTQIVQWFHWYVASVPVRSLPTKQSDTSLALCFRLISETASRDRDLGRPSPIVQSQALQCINQSNKYFTDAIRTQNTNVKNLPSGQTPVDSWTSFVKYLDTMLTDLHQLIAAGKVYDEEESAGNRTPRSLASKSLDLMRNPHPNMVREGFWFEILNSKERNSFRKWIESKVPYYGLTAYIINQGETFNTASLALAGVVRDPHSREARETLKNSITYRSMTDLSRELARLINNNQNQSKITLSSDTYQRVVNFAQSYRTIVEGISQSISRLN